MTPKWVKQQVHPKADTFLRNLVIRSQTLLAFCNVREADRCQGVTGPCHFFLGTTKSPSMPPGLGSTRDSSSYPSQVRDWS